MIKEMERTLQPIVNDAFKALALNLKRVAPVASGALRDSVETNVEGAGSDVIARGILSFLAYGRFLEDSADDGFSDFDPDLESRVDTLVDWIDTVGRQNFEKPGSNEVIVVDRDVQDLAFFIAESKQAGNISKTVFPWREIFSQTHDKIMADIRRAAPQLAFELVGLNELPKKITIGNG